MGKSTDQTEHDSKKSILAGVVASATILTAAGGAGAAFGTVLPNIVSNDDVSQASTASQSQMNGLTFNGTAGDETMQSILGNARSFGITANEWSFDEAETNAAVNHAVASGQSGNDLTNKGVYQPWVISDIDGSFIIKGDTAADVYAPSSVYPSITRNVNVGINYNDVSESDAKQYVSGMLSDVKSKSEELASKSSFDGDFVAPSTSGEDAGHMTTDYVLDFAQYGPGTYYVDADKLLGEFDVGNQWWHGKASINDGGLKIKKTENQTIVMNLHGDDIHLKKYMISNDGSDNYVGSDAANPSVADEAVGIIWNMPNAKTVSTDGGVSGVFIAPNAAFKNNNTSAGWLVADKVDTTGGKEWHDISQWHDDSAYEKIGGSIAASKVLDGGELKNGQFKFVAKDGNGNIIGEGANEADGDAYIRLDDSTSMQDGALNGLTVSEVDDGQDGVEYDSHTVDVSGSVSTFGGKQCVNIAPADIRFVNKMDSSFGSNESANANDNGSAAENTNNESTVNSNESNENSGDDEAHSSDAKTVKLTIRYSLASKTYNGRTYNIVKADNQDEALYDTVAADDMAVFNDVDFENGEQYKIVSDDKTDTSNSFTVTKNEDDSIKVSTDNGDTYENVSNGDTVDVANNTHKDTDNNNNTAENASNTAENTNDNMNTNDNEGGNENSENANKNNVETTSNAANVSNEENDDAHDGSKSVKNGNSEDDTDDSTNKNRENTNVNAPSENDEQTGNHVNSNDVSADDNNDDGENSSNDGERSESDDNVGNGIGAEKLVNSEENDNIGNVGNGAENKTSTDNGNANSNTGVEDSKPSTGTLTQTGDDLLGTSGIALALAVASGAIAFIISFIKRKLM